MSGLDLAELAARLALSVNVLTGYPPPSVPEIAVVPPAMLERIACTTPCRAQGAYLDDRNLLLLAQSLKPGREPRDRAVLLHELVHRAQDLAGAWSDLPPCERRYRREAQAYAAEHAYLRRYGLSGVTLAGPQRWLGAGCGGASPKGSSARAMAASPGTGP